MFFVAGPRPESYREDVENGKDFNTEEERQSFYSECKAGWMIHFEGFIDNFERAFV